MPTPVATTATIRAPAGVRVTRSEPPAVPAGDAGPAQWPRSAFRTSHFVLNLNMWVVQVGSGRGFTTPPGGRIGTMADARAVSDVRPSNRT